MVISYAAKMIINAARQHFLGCVLRSSVKMFNGLFFILLRKKGHFSLCASSFLRRILKFANIDDDSQHHAKIRFLYNADKELFYF